jgi:hypothetical protein
MPKGSHELLNDDCDRIWGTHNRIARLKIYSREDTEGGNAL